MRLRLERVSRRPGIPWWAAAITALWAVLVLWAGEISRSGGPQFVYCPFKTITGIPCPTCGGTRAGLELLDGDIVGAWRMNPLLMTILAVWFLLIVLRVTAGRAVRLTTTRTERRVLWALSIVVVAAGWYWVIRYTG